MNRIFGMFSSALLPITLAATTWAGAPAKAEDACGTAGCEVVFEYTRSLQTWNPPAGVTEVRFELYGAAGGGGAPGGMVSGTLHSLPSTLYIMVGGQGSVSNFANGGLNGGGGSGESSGNFRSGSGGGASDIRLSTTQRDHLVVAGGGGGQGSRGALGGAGGGLVAAPGEAGSGGLGGQGGSQSDGGAGALLGQDFAGQSGSLRQGGKGGSSEVFSPQVSGGGGGGGYFGGGGGAGSDSPTDSGSGGGGGSSFADPTVTSGVTHQQGVRAGNGLVILRYGGTPTVESFTGTQVSTSTAEFVLDFGAPVAGLEPNDFATNSESGCRVGGVEGGPAWYRVALVGCMANPVRLTLAANSVTVDKPGPLLPQTAELTMVTTAPSFSITGNPTSSSGDFNFDVQHGPQVQPLKLSDFEISGCNASIRPIESGTRLGFQNCADGTVRITLKANSIQDAFGNAAPSEPITRTVRIDGARPTLRLELLAPTFGADGLERVRVKLIASEPVSVRVDTLSVAPAGDCRVASSGAGSERILTIAGCSNGEYRLIVPIGAVADLSGWYAPTSAMSLPFGVTEGIEAVAPAPGPNPSQAPTPPPTQIAPWIPIDMTTDVEPVPTTPIVVPDGAAGAGDLEQVGLSIWLVPAGLSGLFLLMALVLLRRRRRHDSTEDDGPAAVKKHSVFSKPADSLR